MVLQKHQSLALASEVAGMVMLPPLKEPTPFELGLLMQMKWLNLQVFRQHPMCAE